MKRWSNSRVGDNTCVIGDSWAEGIAPYFATGITASGKQLWYIMQHCVPQILVYQRYVLYCGLNDITDPYHGVSMGTDHRGREIGRYASLVTCLSKLCSMFNKDANRQKHLYVCTFPNLKYPSGYKNCITRESLYHLNGAISTAANTASVSRNNIHVINVDDSFSQNNLDKTGYHLNSYEKLAQYIHEQIYATS